MIIIPGVESGDTRCRRSAELVMAEGKFAAKARRASFQMVLHACASEVGVPGRLGGILWVQRSSRAGHFEYMTTGA